MYIWHLQIAPLDLTWSPECYEVGLSNKANDPERHFSLWVLSLQLYFMEGFHSSSTKFKSYICSCVPFKL